MKAAHWNQLYPAGTPVTLTTDDGDQIKTITRSEAWELGSGHSVVKVEGRSGGMALSRVQPTDPVKYHRLHQAFNEVQQMPLHEILDMMTGSGVAKVSSVFRNHDDEPVFAVVMLSGEDLQRYLSALEAVEG